MTLAFAALQSTSVAIGTVVTFITLSVGVRARYDDKQHPVHFLLHLIMSESEEEGPGLVKAKFDVAPVSI